MSTFEDIRPYYDNEVNEAIGKIIDDPMLKAMMNFTFPGAEDSYWKNLLMSCNSIRDFQTKIIYPGVKQVLQRSSEGFTTSGFEKLDKNQSYLYISNHRDIIMDTSLLNTSLYEAGLKMTTYAIGDNLVKKPLLRTLSRLTRNFVIKRGLQSRDLLESSKTVSSYIKHSLLDDNRSVWIAQKEGRTKDGNDVTHRGVLKMISMAADPAEGAMEYFRKINIVPVSISYEYDPTDVLKMPELIAKAKSETYFKSENEDFINLFNGIIGQKKRIHLNIGNILNAEIAQISEEYTVFSKQLSALTELIDKNIQSGYKLWPTNYIAHDMLYGAEDFVNHYTQEEKEVFQDRLNKRLDFKDQVVLDSFLAMYANPVSNKKRILEGISE